MKKLDESHPFGNMTHRFTEDGTRVALVYPDGVWEKKEIGTIRKIGTKTYTLQSIEDIRGSFSIGEVWEISK